MKRVWVCLVAAALVWGGCSGSDSDDGATQAPDDGADGGSDDSNNAPDDAGDGEPDAVADEDAPMEGDVPEAMPVEQTLTLTTDDGKSLAATFFHPDGVSVLPAVLLLHQFAEDQSQWGQMPQRFGEAGVAVLTLDLRGHGGSDPQNGAPTDIFRDPNQAPLDVAAAVAFLKASPLVMPERLGVIGTSVGANLAVVAMVQQQGVEAIVSISPRLSAIEDLAGNPAQLAVSSIYCVAGDQDGGGAQADSCRTLVEGATGSTELLIYENSGAHGVDVLEAFPQDVEAMERWLVDALSL